MFVRQRPCKFKLFSGLEPPIDYMRHIVRKALSPVAIRDEKPVAESRESGVRSE